MTLIDNLNWRYATKKYDTTKKVAEKDIEFIKEAIRLAASSYGLQPYQVLEIKDVALRKELQPLSWNQGQVVDASHLFVFCNQISVNDENVDDYVSLKATTSGIDKSNLDGYSDFVKVKMKEKTGEEMTSWTAKQTYIALANAMNACAELKIDSTPMEGFDSNGVNKLLNLTKQGLNASVILAIGYRDKADATQHSKKVRKSLNFIFNVIH